MKEFPKEDQLPRFARLIRRLRILLLSMLLFLAVLYSVLQSESFYTNLLIPKLSSALGLRIEVGGVRVSPMSFIGVRDLVVVTSDEKRHTLGNFSLKYNLLPLFWGVLRLESIELSSATLDWDSFVSGELEPTSPAEQGDSNSSGTSDAMVIPWYLSHLEVGEVLIRECDVQDIPGLGERGVNVEGLNLRIEGYGSDVKFPGTLEFEFQTPKGNRFIPEKGVFRLDTEWAFTPTRRQILGHVNLSLSELQGDAGKIRTDGKELEIVFDMRLAEGVLAFDEILIALNGEQSSLLDGKGGVDINLTDGSLAYHVDVAGINDATISFLGGDNVPVSDLNADIALKGEWGVDGFFSNNAIVIKTLQYGNTWVLGDVLEGSRVELAINAPPDGLLKFALEGDFLRERNAVADISATAEYVGNSLHVKGDLEVSIPSALHLVSKNTPWISGKVVGAFDFSMSSGRFERLQGEFGFDDIVSSIPFEPLNGKLVATVAAVARSGYEGQVSVDIENATVGPILNLGFDGSLFANKDRPLLAGNLQTTLMRVEHVLGLIPRLGGGGIEESKQQSSSSADAGATTSDGAILPVDLDVGLDFQEWSFRRAKLRGLQGGLKVTPGLYELRDLKLDFNGSTMSGHLQVPGDFSLDKALVDFEAKNIELSELIGVIDPKAGRDVSGLVKRFKATTQQSSSGSKGRQQVHVISLGATMESLRVPAYMQETPPLNLLFLPIDALNATIGTLGSVVLPDELVEVVSSVNGTFKEMGQIGFDEARIRLRIDSQGTRVEDTVFNGAILPTLTFNGEVGVDGTLEMVIGVEILKVPVPLTVGGTLDVPLPDLISFPYEVARGIGLGFANIAGLVIDSGEDDALVPEEDE